VQRGDRHALHAESDVPTSKEAHWLLRGVKYGASREGDVKHSLADISRATECFAYKPLVDFEEGLRRTVEWYRTQSKETLTAATSR